MGIELFPHQKQALPKIKNGSILCGGTGSGKSITSLAYYFTKNGGELNPYKKMQNPKQLVIITTARKRDEGEWEDELIPFLLSKYNNEYEMSPIIDSWNNIKKYIGVKDSFFIFDEQRVVGSGTWVKTFLKITKNNEWILLSATPGDKWEDYIPVFVANGFYRNITDFKEQHIVYHYTNGNFPVVYRYLNTGRLLRLKNSILVDMKFDRKTEQHNIDIFNHYDKFKYKDIFKNRWNYEKDKPIESSSELCYELRRVCNSDPDRIKSLIDICEERRKVIIFYNFDYELELIKFNFEPLDFDICEWNGHKHQPVPDTDKWIYLVQYNAGAEAWNCIKTDTIVFYSQTYSYKTLKQAMGRIDRLNTPFIDLYYYHLKSKSDIDICISRALLNKKKFNETKFISGK